MASERALFTEEEMLKAPSDNRQVIETIKYDRESDRHIKLSRFTGRGDTVHSATHVCVSGKGVPGNVEVVCSVQDINLIARVLLDATFDSELIAE
jgi:hypothetical protein